MLIQVLGRTLLCTALDITKLHNNALHSTEEQYKTMYCTILHSTKVHFIAQVCTVCIVLHFNIQNFTVLYSNHQYFLNIQLLY